MKVLIVASNRTLTLSLLQALSSAGIKAHVLAGGNYPVIRASKACLSFMQYNPELTKTGDPLLADIIDQHALETQCEAIIPSGIEAVKYLAEHSARIKNSSVVPLPPLSTILKLNDKWDFHRYACACGVSTPKAELVSGCDKVDVDSRQYPLILKPIDWDGSRGVFVVKTPAELSTHLSRLADSKMLPVMIQEYIHGDDISISVLADHGKINCWAVHTWIGKQHDLKYIYDSEVVDAAARIVQSSKYHGLVNFDFRRDIESGILYAIECNPRPWASIHIAAYAGINFAHLAIEMALNHDLPEVTPPSSVFIHPERAIKMLTLGKVRYGQLSDATIRGLEMRKRDKKASLIRLIEKHVPAYTRLTDAVFNKSESIHNTITPKPFVKVV